MARLLSIIAFFLIGLLTVFPAPAYYLWLLAIIVSEFSLFFVALMAVLLVAGVWFKKYQWPCVVIGAAAIGLYLSPILRAAILSRSVDAEITAALGKPSQINVKPFSLLRLVSPAAKSPFKTYTYVKYADTALTLNYYAAKFEGIRPCVIVIHGGSWDKGDKQQLPELNSYLALKGYNVAAIDYRMAPKYLNPTPVLDVREAIRYLSHNARQLAIDTNSFILLGRSAGAQIALLAAYTLRDTRIKGVIDYYGPADMVWGYSVPGNPWIMDSRAVMEAYLGGSYDMVPDKYKASSPLEFANSYNAIPTLIIHGGNDVLVAYEHSRRLDLKLEQHSIKHYWLRLPWATHGFDFMLNGPGGQLSTYAVERFLKSLGHSAN